MSSEQVSEVQDCAVCLQKCHYPTQLPCGHIFCFLCVKGIAIQSKKCAMCRAEILPDYLDHPVLLQTVPIDQSTPANEDYHWYYEGRNGWWKYDERSNSELEVAFNAGDPECKLLLAGALYCVNFENMIQVQCRDHSRRRRVRRDTPTLPAKGIAGIKIPDNAYREPVKNDSEDSPNNDSNQETAEIDTTEEEGSDTAGTASHDTSIGEILQRVSSLDLQEQSLNENGPSRDTASETEET